MTTHKSPLKIIFSLLIAAGLVFTTSCSCQKEESSSDNNVEMSVDESSSTIDETPETKVVETEPTEDITPPKPVAEVEGEGADLENTYVDANGNTVYTITETPPEFVGGHEALYKYIKENMQYPDDARRAGSEGNVEVSFVVAIDGSIRDVELVDPHEVHAFNEEATRVVSTMPGWHPGRVNGIAVDTKFSLPIEFKLN